MIKQIHKFKTKHFIFPVLWFILTLLQTGLVFAQFNGNFDIEKHFLLEENSLDWKAYQPSKTWLYDWYNSQSGMVISVGSLSQEHFYSESEARLTAEFGDYFAIMYSRNEESFVRKNPAYQETEFRFGGLVAASIIGFPEHDKKYNNIGAAITLGKRWTWNYLRLSFLDQFFEYDDKNDNDDKNSVTDKYITTPEMHRMEIQTFIGERLFFKIDFGQEHETVFSDELTNETKIYRGFDYRGTLDLIFPDSWLFGVSGRKDFEKRDILPDLKSDSLPDLSQNMELQIREVYLYIWVTNDDQLSFGYLEQYFSNEINSSIELQKYEHTTKAHLYWIKQETRTSEVFQWTFEVIAGNVYLYKDNRAEDEIKNETTDQGKFKLGMTMISGDRAKLLLTSTFDLDYSERRVWDGGGVQFQIVF